MSTNDFLTSMIRALGPESPVDYPDTAGFAERFAAHQTDRSESRGGIRYRFKFPNGWGASVVMNDVSYGGSEGQWELAVLGIDGHLNYEHPVAEGDVRGRLTDADVAALLAEIAATVAP